MILVKITCEIRFSERISLLHGYEAIHKDVLKKAPEHPEQWLIPGLVIEDKEKKRSWLIDQARSAIDVEQADTSLCKSSIIEFFNSMKKNLGFPTISRYGLRSTWINEFNVSFQDLVKTTKQKFYNNFDLVKKADDVGIVFDYFTDTGKKTSVSIGPMEYNQLRSQFLRFDLQSIPKVFLYVSVDIGDTNTRGFSSTYLEDFVDRSINEGQKFSEDVMKMVGV